MFVILCCIQKRFLNENKINLLKPDHFPSPHGFGYFEWEVIKIELKVALKKTFIHFASGFDQMCIIQFQHDSELYK